MKKGWLCEGKHLAGGWKVKGPRSDSGCQSLGTRVLKAKRKKKPFGVSQERKGEGKAWWKLLIISCENGKKWDGVDKVNELWVRGKGRRVSESEATIRVSQRHELLEKRPERWTPRGTRGGCRWLGQTRGGTSRGLANRLQDLVGRDSGSPLSLWSANVFEPTVQHLALSWIRSYTSGDWASVIGNTSLAVGPVREPRCAGAGHRDSSSSRGTSNCRPVPQNTFWA